MASSTKPEFIQEMSKLCLLEPRPRLEENDDLGSHLWERLPEALIELVVSKLPFSSLGRFCLVCRRWRNLILTSTYYLVSVHAGQLVVHGSHLGTWESMPLPFLAVDKQGSELVASAGGLLCFSTTVFGEFIICNPLTQRCRRLQMPCGESPTDSQEPWMPPPYAPLSTSYTIRIKNWSLLVGLVVNAGYFKLIVAASYGGAGFVTLVYDCRSDCWKKVANMPAGTRHLMKPIECRGDLFCCLRCHSRDQGRHARLVKYDVDQERWRWGLVPDTLGYPLKLIDYNGKVLLITDVSNQNPESGLGFFEFAFTDDGKNAELVFLRLTNSPLLTRAYESIRQTLEERAGACGVPHVECFGQGDVLFFVGNIDRSDSRRHCLRVWIHNSSTNSNALSQEWLLDDLPTDLSFQVLKPSMISCK